MIAKVRRQRKKKSLFFQVVFFSFSLLLIGFLVFSVIKIRKRRTELSEKIEQLKEEIELLEQNKQQLEAGLSETEKESYWEERAREQGFVKEGENPVVILPSSETEEKEEFGGPGFFESLSQKIKNLFARVIQW